MHCALLLGAPARRKKMMSSMASLTTFVNSVRGFTVPRTCLSPPSASRFASSIPFAQARPLSSLNLSRSPPLQYRRSFRRWQPQQQSQPQQLWWSASCRRAASTGGDNQSTPEPPTDVSDYEDLFNTSAFWDANLKNEDVEKMLNQHFSMAAPTTDFWNTVVRRRHIFVDTAKPEHNQARHLEGIANMILNIFATDPLSLWIKSPQREDDMNRKNVFNWVRSSLKKKPENLHKAILNDLEAFASSNNSFFGGIKTLNCSNNNVKIFYVGRANFRHKGKDRTQLLKVFLNKPEADHDDRVLIYHTNSGTGKSVELAASGYLRGGVMSIMNMVSKDIPTRDDTTSRKSECREALFSCLDEIVRTDKDIFETLIKSMNAWEEPATTNSPTQTPESVRIVFCIDEASSCPNLLRAIISEYKALGEELGEYIANGFGGTIDTTTARAIQVLFSAAGTGAYGGSFGSLDTNYQYLTPTGNVVGEGLYNTLTSEYEYNDRNKIGTLPAFKELEAAPFLWVIVQQNARMASILIDKMYNLQLRYNHPHEEATLMSLVFERYIRSNGMRFLWYYQGDFDQSKLSATSSRLHVGSMGLATYFYPQPATIPEDEDEMNELAVGFDYGIEFQSSSAPEGKAKSETGSESESSNAVVPHGSNVASNRKKRRRRLMELLVRECGLVTQREFSEKTSNNVLEEPFILNEAMQLLCVWFMQGSQRLRGTESLLETTPFRFEMLSTQLVSCAISAAMTVQVEHRPNVHMIFAKALGMFRSKCTLEGKEMSCVDPNVEAAWAALKDVIPVTVECKLAMDGMYRHKSPMWLKVKSEAEGDEESDTSKEDGKTSATATNTKPKDPEAWDNMASMAISKGDTLDLRSLEYLDEMNDFDADVAMRSQQDETLIMDQDMLQGLTQMRQNKACDGPSHHFTPALCSVAEGTSNVADGTISFIGAKWNEMEGKLEGHAMYTICVQADDVFEGHTTSTQIRDKVNAVKHELLDIPFGKNRLICMLSTEEELLDAPMEPQPCSDDQSKSKSKEEEIESEAVDELRTMTTTKRSCPIVSFQTNEPKILAGVMMTLDERRKRQEKSVEHGVMLKYEEQ